MHLKYLTRMALLLCLQLGIYMCPAEAQSDEEHGGSDQNSLVYVEFLGNGLGLSANYGHLFRVSEIFVLAPSAGIGLGPFGEWTIPLELTANLGFPRSFEIGLGTTPTSSGPTFLLGRIGYRSINLNKGVLFRIGVTPVFRFDVNPGMMLCFGLSFGGNF